MSFLKKPFKKLKEMGSSSSQDNTSTDSISRDTLPSKTEGISGDATPQSVTASKDLKSNGIDSPSATDKVRSSLAVAFANGGKTKTNDSGTSTPERSGSRRQSRDMLDQERVRRSVDKERVKKENKQRQSLAKIEDERFLQEGPPELTRLYRPYSMIMSKHWLNEERLLFKTANWQGT